jgi:prepilin-type N-terminal cleavage/methylation domain-containing protein
MMQIGGYMFMKPMNKRGVTLIELVVVMVIIAIGAVLLVPNIGVWLPNYRLRSATRDIVSTMRTAQMKAVSTNFEYRAYFNAGEGRYWIERGNQNTGSTNWVGTTDPGNVAREGPINTLPTGVTINLTGFIEFNPDSTCNAATITLTNSKGKQSSITLVTSTGKVNVSS